MGDVSANQTPGIKICFRNYAGTLIDKPRQNPEIGLAYRFLISSSAMFPVRLVSISMTGARFIT